MQAIVLALGASLTWGLADFFGPLQGRVLGVLRTLVYVQLGGLVGIALIVAARWQGPADAVALLAIPAAVSGTLGLFAYYGGIAVGAISIVAPIAGVSAVVPVIVGIASGESPSLWQLAGIACALVGVFLAALEPRSDRETRLAAGFGLAVLAAIGVGGYFPFMHAPGCGDMFGNLLFAAASTSGLVSITSVLASLYPIVTVVLARLVLAERVARSQEAGIALTLAGVVLISVG